MWTLPPHFKDRVVVGYDQTLCLPNILLFLWDWITPTAFSICHAQHHSNRI